MRKDMKRVIVETVRYGGGYAKPGRQVRDFEDAPTKEPMRNKRRGWGTKNQSDRLQPLWRFLEKSVGRHWDDVWSEICEHNDARDVMGVHVRNHVWDFVERQGSVRIRWWRRSFYIDDEGYLRTEPGRKYTWRRPAPEYIESQGQLLKQEKGIWYFYEHKEITYQELDHTQMLVQKTEVPIYRTRTYKKYMKLKQLNKKELRQHGVENRPEN